MMDNKEITIYTGNRSSDIVKSNNGNNQTDIVKSNENVEVNILATLDADTLDKTKRIRNLDENALAVYLALFGKIPTLEEVARIVLESENDTSSKELLALNQYEGNIEELIEVLVISRSEMAIDEYHDYDKVGMMLIPIDADIEAFVSAQDSNLVPYLHPAYEESNDRYALTAFSPVNNLPVDISKDENNALSTDGFNGYESINPNNQLLLEQAQSKAVVSCIRREAITTSSRKRRQRE